MNTSPKSRLPFNLLAAILSFAVISAFLLFGCNSLSAGSNLFTTSTPTATIIFTSTSTLTSAPTATPTANQTNAPQPTPTATPDQRVLNPANQHLYLYVRILKTWHGARDYCASLGGYLATIQAPSEDKFVYDLATDNIRVYTWLGATDEVEEGIWVWITGERWTYFNWNKTYPQPEPNNKYGGEVIINADYMAFGGSDRTWTDQPDVDGYFVCEWESASP